MFLYMSLNPSPHLGFKLEMVYTSIWWEVSNLYSEIPSCKLHLIHFLADDILVPLLKRDQKEHNYYYY